MDTKIIKIDKDNFNQEDLNKAAKIIKANGVVAFPTETVYGLGANGLNPEAVKKIYRAKGRPSDNPLILHIGEVSQLDDLVEEITEEATKCIEEFWPGPITIILKRKKVVPDIITAGLDTVAVRMPESSIARTLINLAKVPIAAPSANLSGRPSPTSAGHVIEDMMGKIDMIIDGGETGIGIESTVLDLSGSTPIILRPGGITYEDLKRILPDVVEDKANLENDIIPKSPGQKYRHYAPKAEMLVFTGNLEAVVNNIDKYTKQAIIEGKKVGIMATDETKEKYNDGTIKSLGTRMDKTTIANSLFSALREFDHLDIDIIFAEGVEKDNIGLAIMNRMMKASGGKTIKC
ncbi:L-threonylcarbamoyladenylate synthase [Tissierella creatinophila]|uniref:Threonylcarbamoyl-AMP synthase n=1 Tax=Tissierella creatinophila DSM 6911 TaxID=1123403 RepID=A0A1U7M3C8_TISCR|nr:L-threonylcarbamoyladenylate synthase [Tissierella creatinophila]OLS01817.1 threonylcarbamoyl-AMP synthase [Tissierella creatinophila DSM 6911]